MKRILVVLIVAIVVSLGIARTARADAAPPMGVPGSSIDTPYPTNVQMVSEDVLITLKDDLTAEVVATFDLRNQSDTPEAFDVRFPISTDDGHGQIRHVKNFAAWVDGKLIETYENEEPCLCYEGISVPWAHWHVEFPPHQTVKVAVSYQLVGANTGKLDPSPFYDYQYILRTGAGWYGKIGEGTIRFRLPYTAAPEAIGQGEWNAPAPAWHTIEGTDVVWHFTDLEPTEADDIAIVALDPKVWRAIEAARYKAAQEPDSLDAQLYLAHSLKSSLWIDRGGVIDTGTSAAILVETITAYECVLELAPNNVDLNVEYVTFLFDTSYSHVYPQLPEPAPEPIQKFYVALEQALLLAPEDQRLLDVQQQAFDIGMLPSPAQSPAIAATPTHLPGNILGTAIPRPTDTQTETQAEHVAEVIAATEATDQPPSNTSQSATSAGGCFGISALILILLGIVIMRRRR